MADKTETENQPQTKVVDWMDDSYTMEITEGVKFDPEHDYTLELTEIKREVGQKDGKPWDRLTLAWTEEETGVTLRESFFLQPKVSMNKEDVKKTNKLVKLANALGYKAEIGDKSFHPKKFLKMGMKIIAHVVEQVNVKTKEKTGFNEIDILTIRPFGKKAQQMIEFNPADIAKWQGEITAGGFKTMEAYVQSLAASARLPEVTDVMKAAGAGKFTFPA